MSTEPTTTTNARTLADVARAIRAGMLADAVEYRDGETAAECTECGPLPIGERCADHARDAETVARYYADADAIDAHALQADADAARLGAITQVIDARDDLPALRNLAEHVGADRADVADIVAAILAT